MNYCKKCGQEIHPDLFMCPRCKRPIELDPDDKISYREKAEYPYRTRGKGVLILGSIFIFISLALLSGYYYWMSYYLTEYGNPGLYAGGFIFSIMLVGISILIIIVGLLLYYRKERN